MFLKKAQMSTRLADQHETSTGRRKKANSEQPAKPDGGEAGIDERPAKRAKAASKKPPAAAKANAAPKAAPKKIHEAHVQRRHQENYQASQRAREQGRRSQKEGHRRARCKLKEETGSIPMYSIWPVHAIFGHQITGSTCGAINEALLACIHTFWAHNRPMAQILTK
jgi:hypothetical protein